MNHAGELGPLSRMVRPDVAVITTIEPAHLEFFDSIEAIADAKAEIFEGMKSSGIAVLNQDNAAVRASGRSCPPPRHRPRPGIRRAVRRRHPPARLHAGGHEQRGQGRDPRPAPRLSPGRARAALGAEQPRRAGGGRPPSISISDSPPARSRPQPAQGPRPAPADLACPAARFELIDESYNASPAAMRAAFAVLARAEPGPKRPAHRRAGRYARAGRPGSAPSMPISRPPSSPPASISCSPAGR